MARVLMVAFAVALAVGSATSSAHADDDATVCLERARNFFAKSPALSPAPKVGGSVATSELIVVSKSQALFRCQNAPELPEILVSARRDKSRWVVAPLAALHCPRFALRRGSLTISHADTCQGRWYHPAPCTHYKSRVVFGRSGVRLKRLATRRVPICKICPDSTANDCLRVARRAARRLYDRGQVGAAARLLRAALDHVSHWMLNRSDRADPWAISDALLYSAGLPCAELAETWRRHATPTPRTRRAFETNARRCQRQRKVRTKRR